VLPEQFAVDVDRLPVSNEKAQIVAAGLRALVLELVEGPTLADRVAAGFLLRRLQRGESLGLPHSRPMPTIGPGCHELRIVDGMVSWRIMYHIATDAVVILDVFKKQTQVTPLAVIDVCKRRLAETPAGGEVEEGDEPCEKISGDGWSEPDGRSATRRISCSSLTRNAVSSRRSSRSPRAFDGCANVKE
jgi:phage-related protein